MKTAAIHADTAHEDQEPTMQTDPSPEDQSEVRSKDAFFERLSKLSDEMVAKHGKDFSMGALILAARWIAENRTDVPKSH